MTSPRTTRTSGSPRDDRVSRAPLTSVCVLIPTYNERDSLPHVVRQVREVDPRADILVLDDNSPDGTGLLADEIAQADPQVHVLHRPAKEGLGRAYLAGFEWAVARGYDAVVEMDADGSHRPEHLPALLAAAQDADLVIGSRYVPGGEVVNWPAHRKLLSRAANQYTRMMLGMPVRDATAGYRVYRTSALPLLGLDRVQSQGYCFQVDLTWKAILAGLDVVEVPIVFVERRVGASKMSGDVIGESLMKIAEWGVGHRLEQAREYAASLRARRGQWKSLED